MKALGGRGVHANPQVVLGAGHDDVMRTPAVRKIVADFISRVGS